MSVEAGSASDNPVWQSRRLWSQWDMLKQYSALLGRVIWGLGDFEAAFTWQRVIRRYQEKNVAQPISEWEAQVIREYLDGALRLASELDLELVPHTIRMMQGRLAPEKLSTYTTDQVGKDLETLRGRILDHLDSRYFLFIKRERVDYYLYAEQFGPAVAERFPAAIDDIEGAANCVALDEGTACVLHLMRVMEVGLKALAAPLGIPYAPSWESYLKQIQTKIDAPRAEKSAEWKRDEAFFRDVSGDLISIKQAWRNPTMHVVRKYSADEAEEIFRAVRRFMQRLANGLPKPNASLPP
jgi:hypothetical protein